MFFLIPYLIAIPGIVELLNATSWMQFTAGVVICVMAFAFYAVVAVSGMLSNKYSQPVINLPDFFNQEDEPVSTDQ